VPRRVLARLGHNPYNDRPMTQPHRYRCPHFLDLTLSHGTRGLLATSHEGLSIPRPLKPSSLLISAHIPSPTEGHRSISSSPEPPHQARQNEPYIDQYSQPLTSRVAHVFDPSDNPQRKYPPSLSRSQPFCSEKQRRGLIWPVPHPASAGAFCRGRSKLRQEAATSEAADRACLERERLREDMK
jgi:hypothetical protein